MVLSLALIAVVFATTADLLGRRKAWIAAAFVALEPMLFITSLIGYSETLVTLLFVLTAWAAVKGIKRLPYVALAGFFAGLGFLAKASIGPVFVIALLMVVFVAIALVIVAFPAPYAHVAAMDVLDSRLHPGDIVALDGVSPEAVLPYLSVQDVSLVAFHVGVDAGYLPTARSGPYPGFVEIVSFASGDLVGEAFACVLWGRAAT